MQTMETLPFPFPLIFLGGLLLALAMLLIRVARGPHVLDRIVAADSITLVIICLMGVWQLTVGTTFFFDAILALAIVGFIGTVALAKYLERGGLIH